MSPDNLQVKYAELVALTQLFLLQEYPLDKRIPAESASFEYFKQYALRQRQQGQAKSLTQAPMAPPSPVIISEPVYAPTVKAAAPLPKPQPLNTPSVIIATEPPPIAAQLPKREPTVTVTPISKVEAPPAPKTIEKKKSTGLLELQPMDPPTAADLNEMRTLVREHVPSHVLLDAVPDDSLAKQLLGGWKQQVQAPAVMILTFNDPDKQMDFISNVTKAIRLCLAPAQMMPADKIERDKEWDRWLQSSGLRLILASDYGIYAMPELMKHYKEDSRTAKRYLGKVPLLLLPDISVYLKEPSLKPSLWRALSEILSPK